MLEIKRATMKQKLLRDALHFRVYGIDGTPRDRDEQDAIVIKNISQLAEAAGFPPGTQLTGDMIDDFLTFGAYVSSVEGSDYTPLEAADTINEIAKKFAVWVELEQSTILEGNRQIQEQLRPVNRISAPNAGELTPDEKKGA
jgi:hypothetical protein